MDEIERLKKKLESYPSPSAYSRLAELLRLDGQLDEAASLCQRCIHEFPRNGQAYVILAGVHLSHGNRQIAKETLLTGTRQDRRCYSGLRMLSDLQAEDGEIAEAIASLEAILAFKTNDNSVQQRLADLQRHLADQGGQPARPTPAQSRTEQVMRHSGSVERDTVDLTAAPVSLTSTRLQAVTPPPAAAQQALDVLCNEPGVMGALVVDDKGRLVVGHGLDDDGELLAALAQEVTASSREVLAAARSDELACWVIASDRCQILAFRRGGELSLIVKAGSQCKMALLELRARQALLDLGAQP